MGLPTLTTSPQKRVVMLFSSLFININLDSMIFKPPDLLLLCLTTQFTQKKRAAIS
ncbi:hypothetical protein THOD03_180023 [Vibrio harveyi]|nr:hypothetical protein THOD03_180023 [Vibrio harveyi]